ncbi:hypothetical protein GCM10027514_45370 [Azotobacter armeniacus]
MFYWAMLRALLGSLKHPLILMDWSPIDAAGTLFLLLEALAAMLPARCTPLLVTDAGFRRPWFQAVEAMGWHYVGRVRNRDLCRFGEQPWPPVKSLYALASASPKRLGCLEMTRSAPWSTPLYAVKHAPRGRKHRRVTGTVARDKRSRQNVQRESEPWLLASNLPEGQWNAAQVVAIYQRRMQVEEGFRDLKSPRLGFGLELHRSRCPRRIEILLLIAVLANYALGLQAREAGARASGASRATASRTSTCCRCGGWDWSMHVLMRETFPQRGCGSWSWPCGGRSIGKRRNSGDFVGITQAPYRLVGQLDATQPAALRPCSGSGGNGSTATSHSRSPQAEAVTGIGNGVAGRYGESFHIRNYRRISINLPIT